MQTESDAQLDQKDPALHLSAEVQAALHRHGMTTHVPDMHHLVVHAVPVPNCSKARTNVLLRWDSLEAGCRVYVDHDLDYLGDDPALLEMFGVRRQAWRQLHVDPVRGTPHQAICAVLATLRSPSAAELAELPAWADNDVFAKTPLGRTLGQFAVELDSASLEAAFDRCDRKPFAQSVASITHRQMRGCPVLWGEAGTGKDTLARAAAHIARQHGVFDRVLEINGADLTAGNMYWQDSDSVLMRLIADWRRLSPSLVLFRDIDLGSSGSWISYALLGEAMDQQLRFIGIAAEIAALARFQKDARFASRLVPIEVPHPEPDIIVTAMKRLANDAGVELDTASIDMILHRSSSPDNKQPRLRTSLAILDAAITDVLWRSQREGRRVLPDDIIAITNANWPNVTPSNDSEKE